jgi:hypothetical protein
MKICRGLVLLHFRLEMGAERCEDFAVLALLICVAFSTWQGGGIAEVSYNQIFEGRRQA